MRIRPPHPRSPKRRNDRGFTLPEVLVAVLVSGVLAVAVSAAFSVVARTAEPTEDRLTESRDISFAQTYIPLDMASAIPPTEAEEAMGWKAIIDDAAFDPPGTDLVGTNVISLRRTDIDSGGVGSTPYWVSYRYVQDGDQWNLERHEVRNGVVTDIRQVATTLAEPPIGYVEGVDKPTHAVELNARNQVVLRPVGEDLTLTFNSDTTFTTGGSALSKGLSLATNNFGGFAQTTAPPSKCGGDIALIIDTSGSVPMGHGGVPTEQAARDFIEAFTGTPTRLAIYGYDNSAYQMYPATAGDLVPMLNPTNPAIDAAINRVVALDDLDGAWPGGGAPLSQRDPNGDGIMWDQMGSGTNWEDGVRIAFFANEDPASQYATTPSLAVLVTDGQPNRTISGGDATTEAKNMVAAAKQTGARVVGVLAGNGDEGKMGQVVGTTAYDPDADNASSANYFKSQGANFDQLGELLLEIAIAECGGTVTVQKMIDDGAGNLSRPPSGIWNYTSKEGGGTAELDREKVSSVTFDYTVAANGTVTDTIYEQVGGDYVFDRYECYQRGNLLTSGVSDAIDDETGSVVPGVSVTVTPDSAISCLMISVPK